MKNTKENFNVLSLTLGLRHNDWKKTYDIMEENCLNITPFDLSKNSINSIDITKFDLIELRHCRGWQNCWPIFSQILTKLKKTKIKIINPPEIFFGLSVNHSILQS